MKRCIFGLIVLFSSISSYAQNGGNALRFYSNNNAYNHSVKVTEIDSITYDVDSQLQMIHYNEKNHSFPINEIDSVVFQDKLNYTIIENIAKDVDAVLTEDGKSLIYGVDSLGNRFLQFEKYDFTNMEWDGESLFVVQYDDKGNPISIILSEKVGYLFSYNEETIDVLLLKEDGTYQEFSINENNSAYARSIKNSPRKTPFSDLATDIGRALSIAELVSALESGTGIGKALAGLGALGSITGGDMGTLMSGLSDSFGAAVGSMAARYAVGLAIAKALSEWADEVVRADRVGNWNVELTKSEQFSYDQCKFEYTISGIKPNPKGNPYYMVYIYASGSGRVCAKFGPYKAENKSDTQVFTFSEKGKFDVQIDMYDDKWYRSWGIFKRSNKEMLYMADLQFEKVDVSDECSYSNGNVKYNLSAFIKGNKESLSDVAEYGYYILKPNLVPDYHKATLSTIFASTECTNILDVDRGHFLTKDYNSFHAEASGYKIGVYVKLKNGSEPLRFDEQEIEGLIYKKKPSLTFTSYSLGETTVYVDENDEPYYCSTVINAEYTAKGTFWVNTVDLVVIQGNAEDNVGYWDVMNDGDQPFAAYYDYPYGGDNSCAFRFDFVLSNGNRVSSTNAIQVSGSPIVTNIGLIGANARAAEPYNAPDMKSYGKQGFKPRLVLKKD